MKKQVGSVGNNVDVGLGLGSAIVSEKKVLGDVSAAVVNRFEELQCHLVSNHRDQFRFLWFTWHNRCSNHYDLGKL